MLRARSRLPTRTTAALFAIVFATYASYLRIFGDPHFYYDAASYWSLGGTFGRAGHFSLLDFYSPIRGYSLPLFNRGLSSIASHVGAGSVTIVLIFGSLEIALLGVVLVPRLVRALWPDAHITPARILLFNAIVFFFWRDYLGFPLSDFPAATLAIAALLLLSRRSVAGYALGGLALGLACNVRPAYSVMLVVALIIVALRAGIRRTPLLGARALGLAVAGILVASLPQMLINHRHAHTWSPAVGQIVAVQLTLGMQAQRYETYVGTHYPSAVVLYNDPSTQDVMRRDHLAAVDSVTQYLEIAGRHPTEMLAAWARRVFNGLDIRYSTVYIHDLGATGEWFSLVNYTLLFAALARMLVPAFRRQLGRVSWPEALALCCACIPAIPFAVESRYFLPMQLFVYALVVFGTAPRRAWSDLGRPGQVTLGLMYPAFLLVCITLSTSTIALIAHP